MKEGSVFYSKPQHVQSLLVFPLHFFDISLNEGSVFYSKPQHVQISWMPHFYFISMIFPKSSGKMKNLATYGLSPFLIDICFFRIDKLPPIIFYSGLISAPQYFDISSCNMTTPTM